MDTHPDVWNRAQLASAEADKSGVVFAEYVILVGTVALVVGLSIYGLGVPLIHAFDLTRLFILLPLP